MKVEEYYDAFVASVPHILNNPHPLRRRLTCEGPVAFTSGMKGARDEVLRQGAESGRLDLAHLPFVPKGTFRQVGIEGIGDVLNFLSMFNKMSVVGREVAFDWQDFLSRNTEMGNYLGKTWEDLLPISSKMRETIDALLGPVPSILMGCKHGPGATAERLISMDKWLAVLEPTRRLGYIRMTSVPKDWSSRRIIGIEPAFSQFLQQGIANHLRRSRYGRVFCTSLSDISHHVAAAAHDDRLATIDMKDASDRVPLSLVDYLLGESWGKLIRMASTGYAQIDDLSKESLYRLNMAATMGNGFCFELETIVFHLVTAIIGSNQFQESDTVFLDCLRRVSVFGDDIVAPRHWLPRLEEVYAQCGFILNPKKTCRTSRFKETCGFWIVDGIPTLRYTPALALNGSTLEWETEASQLALASLASLLGYVPLAGALIKPLARVPQRWNKQLQRLEVRLTTDTPNYRRQNVTDEIRYLCYWKTGNATPRQEYVSSETKPRWVPLGSFPGVTSAGSDTGLYARAIAHDSHIPVGSDQGSVRRYVAKFLGTSDQLRSWRRPFNRGGLTRTA